MTARGARHCEELGRLARRGIPVAIVFVAQRGDVEALEPEDAVDLAFGAALRLAAERGVRVLACALSMTPHPGRVTLAEVLLTAPAAAPSRSAC